MSSIRLWLFRGLVVVVAGLMVTSAIMPWWTGDIIPPGGSFTIEIYQYGIPPSAGSQYWAEDITPLYQTVLAYIFLAASVGLILYSTWLKGRKGRWLLGSIGLINIVYAAIAVIWVAIRTGDFGISLQGWSMVYQEGEEATVYASLQFGYYLAYASGLTCIALALLRNKIVGKLSNGGYKYVK